MTHRDPSYTRESERPVGPGRAAWEAAGLAPRPDAPTFATPAHALRYVAAVVAGIASPSHVRDALNVIGSHGAFCEDAVARSQRALDEERRRSAVLADWMRTLLGCETVTVMHDEIRCALDAWEAP